MWLVFILVFVVGAGVGLVTGLLIKVSELDDDFPHKQSPHVDDDDQEFLH
jgi:hypothetical protein